MTWSCVGVGEVCVLRSHATAASTSGGGVPESLSKFDREPSAPLKSASILLHVAGSKKWTGDPLDPWLMASAPRLNWTWASSHRSVHPPSGCAGSRRSWGGSSEWLRVGVR